MDQMQLSGSAPLLSAPPPTISVASWYFPRLLGWDLTSPGSRPCHQSASSIPCKTRRQPLHAMCTLINFTKSLQGSQHSGPFFHELCILSFSHGPCPVLSVGDPSRNKTHLCPQGAHAEWRDIAKAVICVFYTFLCDGRSEHSQTSKVSVQQGLGNFRRPADTMATVVTSHFFE